MLPREARRSAGASSSPPPRAAATVALLIVAVCVAAACPCSARLYYPNFNDRVHLRLVGDAARDGGCVAVVSAGGTLPRSGAVWYASPLRVDGGFSATFHLRAANASRPRAAASGLCGLALVLQAGSASALGEGGGGLGYGGLAEGVAVEFDVAPDAGLRDPAGPHLAVHRSRRGPLSAYEPDLARTAPLPVLGERPGPWQVRYDGRTVRVFHGEDHLRALLSVEVGVLEGLYHVGFTASAGAAPAPPEPGLPSQIVCDLAVHHSARSRAVQPASGDAVAAAAPAVAAALAAAGGADSAIPSPLPSPSPSALSSSSSSSSSQSPPSSKPGLRAGPGRAPAAADGGDTVLDGMSDLEPCDGGFVGPGCVPDVRPVLHQCLMLRTCGACVSSNRDCRWCASKARCVAGVTHDARDAEYCADALEISDEVGCVSVAASLVWVWTAFVSLLVLAVCGGFVARHYRVADAGGGAPDGLDGRARELVAAASATAAGSLFAIGVSYAVNAVLVEVSVSPPLTVVVGLLELFTGGLMLWQSVLAHYGGPGGEFRGSFSHFALLTAFACVNAASGVVCFLLEEDWSSSMSAPAKVPLYALIGVSLCFDLVFLCMGAASELFPGSFPPLVRSPLEVRLMAATSAASGLYFGFLFGSLDPVGGASRSHVELAVRQENSYCYPVAALTGGLATVVARLLRDPSLARSASKLELRHYATEDKDGL